MGVIIGLYSIIIHNNYCVFKILFVFLPLLFIIVRNRGQPLIDILLSAEKKGLMNAQDVGDEVVTIITAVSI